MNAWFTSSSSDDASEPATVSEGVARPTTRPQSAIKAEPSPEPSEEKPPVAIKTEEKEQGDAALSAEQLKKRRRNERDRRRSCVKRETMEQMRTMVAVLERQKQQLMEHIAAADSPGSNGANECQSPTSWPKLVVSTSLYPSPSTPVTRDDYVQLAAEIEAFRLQNAAMVEELARRDLFNNSLRYRLASFPPLDSNSSGMKLAQLTREEGEACVWEALERIHAARLLYASEERFRNRPTFLGWSQYSERQGQLVTFGVKKALRNVTPQELMDRTWQLQIDGHNHRRLGPSHLRTHITLLQKITDDILIMDRRTEDQSRTTEGGQPLVLRTVYVLFRVVEDDGAQTLGIKTLDVPVADRMLRSDEVWWDIFYWIRLSPAESLVASDKQGVTTMTEFGGANACAPEDLASSRLKELIFLAIRWETLAVAPFLLQQ